MIDKVFWIQVKNGWSFIKDVTVEPFNSEEELPPDETIDVLIDDEVL